MVGPGEDCLGLTCRSTNLKEGTKDRVRDADVRYLDMISK